MKKPSSRQTIVIAVGLLVVAAYVALLVAWLDQKHVTDDIQSQITTLIENQSASQASQYTNVTIAPSEKAVYLPLASIKLPASKLTQGLVYSYADAFSIPGNSKVFPAVLSISTHDLAANAASTTHQFDCSQVAYADFVVPSYPVNPRWKSDGNVHLADGRTMNIYYAPSLPGCSQAWQLNKIDSKAIADAFKQAVSY